MPANEDEGEIVTCDVCQLGEVNDPWLDWCIVCERKLCADCHAAYNHEHGVYWCPECFEKEQEPAKEPIP